MMDKPVLSMPSSRDIPQVSWLIRVQSPNRRTDLTGVNGPQEENVERREGGEQFDRIHPKLRFSSH